MKKLLIGLSLFAPLAPIAVADDARSCVQEFDESANRFEVEWGTKCGSEDSMHIPVTNSCDEPIYVSICIEETNGRWNCGSDSNLSPGSTNEGFWSCHATGRSKFVACTGGFEECGSALYPK